MRSDNATADRKAQTHPFGFGGEERLEDVFQFFLPDTGALVGNGYNHRAPIVLNSSTNEQPALRSIATSHRVTSIHY